MGRNDRAQIYNMSWSLTAEVAAKSLGLSISCLRALCRDLHIPTPPLGYWNRVRAGKPIDPPPPLPPVRIAETGMIGEGVLAPRLNRGSFPLSHPSHPSSPYAPPIP